MNNKKQNKKMMAVALALGVSLGVSMFNPVLPTTQVEASSYNYSADQLQALANLNKLRVEAGMNPVKLDPFLTKAATNHFNYLITNGGSFGHDEVRGHKGFTGVSPKDRVQAVGGSVGDYLGESIVFGTNIHTNSIMDLVHEAPLHREDLLNPDLQSVGIEVEKGNPKGFHVIKVRIDKYGERDSDHVYPVNGMKNVNPLFGGNEIPNPLKNYGISQSGHILTYWLPLNVAVSDGDLTFVLKDSKGVVVPAFVDFKMNQAVRLIPKQQLKWGETYTATVKWTSPEDKMSGGRTWSFTTMTSDPNGVTPTKPTPPPVEVIKESKDYMLIKGQPLYASNSTKSKQIVQVPANAKVRSSEKRSSWMKVTYNGKTGWVAVSNLKAYVAPKTVTMYANKASKAYTTRSSKGKVAFNLSNGAKVTRLGVNGSWSQVKLGTKTGWVASRDLSASAPVATKSVVMQTNKKATVYTTRSTKGKVAFTVPAKAKVTRLAVNASWSQVKYGSKTGWVASSSLSTMEKQTIAMTTDVLGVSVTNRVYKDLNMKYVSHKNIKWALDRGYLNAYVNTTHPAKKMAGKANWSDYGSKIKERDMLATVFRYARSSEYGKLKVANKKNSHSKEYQLAAKYGVKTRATVANTSKSSQAVTRIEFARALSYAHYGKKVTDAQAIKFMYTANVTQGNKVNNKFPKTTASFGSNVVVTRADVALGVKAYDNYKVALAKKSQATQPAKPPVTQPTQPAKPPATTTPSKTIKTQYGSHTYGVDSQAEYDAVMKLVRDEFNKSFNSKEFDVHPDIYRVLNGERGTTNRSDPKFLSPENVGLLDAEIAARPLLEGRISLDTYKQIYRANAFFSHLMRVSGTKNVVGNKNVKSAHDALIKKTTDCDATAHVQSIVYDMVGIDNAVIGDGVTHAMIVLKVKEGWMDAGTSPFTKEQINQVNRDNIYLSYTQSGSRIQ